MGGSVFVLFVDDDVAFADEAARSLESVGMRTVVALGSLAALDAFDANAIDVVVTDIKLPAGEITA
jgi:CheY-like chemotaxis protein